MTTDVERGVYAASPVLERRPVRRRTPALEWQRGYHDDRDTHHGSVTSFLEQPAVDVRPINGPAAAAVLAAGIGGALLGIVVTAAQAFPPLARMFAFPSAVGPLSGKTTVAMVAWLAIWAVVHWRWRDRDVPFRGITTATIVLLIVALLGTFPPVY
jgi:hypothetical protein